MLVRVDEVVICRVVEEDEAEADGEAGETGADPDEAGVGGPGEDEKTDGDEPAGEHHRDEADFGRGAAVVGADEGEVVVVDKAGTTGGADDADCERNEH